MTSALLAAAIVLGLVLHLAWLVRSRHRSAARVRAADAASVARIIDKVTDASDGTAGVVTWRGVWRGSRVQVRTIVDTLATRKLPTRWLSVSITEKVAVRATFDMMMRPGAPTTFSNFDLLPHVLPPRPGLPEGAAMRSDARDARFPQAALGHLGLFAEERAKELLVTPNGVRIVWLLAEADRARYGVFRQAEFSEGALEPDLIERLLTAAASLREAVNSAQRQAA